MSKFMKIKSLSIPLQQELTNLLQNFVLTQESVCRETKHFRVLLSWFDIAPEDLNEGDDTRLIGKSDLVISACDKETDNLLSFEGICVLVKNNKTFIPYRGRTGRRGNLRFDALPERIEGRVSILNASLLTSLGSSLELRRPALSQNLSISAYATSYAERVSSSQATGEEPSQRLELAGGAISVTIHRYRDGELMVSAETSEEAWARKTLMIQFVSDRGEVLHFEEIQLAPVLGETGLWEGRWSDIFDYPTGTHIEFSSLKESVAM